MRLTRWFMLSLLATSGPSMAETIAMSPDRWDLQNANFEAFDGKQVLRLGSGEGPQRKGGAANIKGLQFTTGVIEYDMWLPDAREFSGPIFRQPDDLFGEIIYFRPHLNGKPDAIQYTPVVNGNLAWQIFTGPGFEAEVTYPLERWFHARLDVYLDSAQLSLDGKPVLHIPDLKNETQSGALGFAALMGGTRYANIEVEPIADYRDPSPGEPPKAQPQGTVTGWQVTQALTQGEAFKRAAAGNWQGVKWHPIAIETNGIANLSKAGPDGGDKHSFIARFDLSSPRAKSVPMAFGFSDKVRIYLNGKPLYEGADLQFSRDYRFLGHVGFWDSLFLMLKPGANTVAFVVTDDTNGGTAAAARFEPDPDLTIR